MRFVLGWPCTGSNWTMVFAELVILSFFFLFLDFFRKTYKSAGNKNKKAANVVDSSTEPGDVSTEPLGFSTEKKTN
jgi:GNS1/SUR4 family